MIPGALALAGLPLLLAAGQAAAPAPPIPWPTPSPAASAAPAPWPPPERLPGQQTLVSDFRAVTGIVYATAGGIPLELDVYKPRRPEAPSATAILFHGGGWVAGSRQASVLWAIPWLEAGYSVVTVQYRLGPQAPAPAAVEDALCAVRWVFAQAAVHGFDPGRIVTTGDSAGGHLALLAAMVPSSSGLARSCPFAAPQPLDWSTPPPEWDPKVAAVVSWYGVTDVADLLEGPNARTYAVQWLGARADRAEVARLVSPLSHVRAGVPPVLTIHGDADAVVPYAHAVRLHDALGRAGVSHRLVTIPGGGHGGFDRTQLARIADETRTFLRDAFQRSAARPVGN